MTPTSISPELEELLKWAKAHVAAMSPEQYAEMIAEGRKSWVRAFEPCPHGMVDFEQCPECWKEAMEKTQ